MFQPVSPFYGWVKLPAPHLSGMASRRHGFSQKERQDSQSMLGAVFIAEVASGERSRFHHIFMAHKILCHGSEKPGAAQISTIPER